MGGPCPHHVTRVEREAGPDLAAQIDRAYLLTVCRMPGQAERAAMLRFLDRESQGRLADVARAGSALTSAPARHQALVQLCRAIFNTNEFVYPD